MPNETPFGSLESLVGRTFEKAGTRHRVHDSDGFIVVTMNGRTGETETWFGENFAMWLSGAKEVTP